MKNGSLQQKVRRARSSQKLTLRDVERISQGSLTNVYVSNIELGRNKEPSPKKLRALASALKLDFLELMILADYLTIRELKGKV